MNSFRQETHFKVDLLFKNTHAETVKLRINTGRYSISILKHKSAGFILTYLKLKESRYTPWRRFG
jgi:hypothetical protein